MLFTYKFLWKLFKPYHNVILWPVFIYQFISLFCLLLASYKVHATTTTTLQSNLIKNVIQEQFIIPSQHLRGNVTWNLNDSSSSSSPHEYFDQINARNHRPVNMAESQSRVSIVSPSSGQETSPNVFYYSPKSYGKSTHSKTEPSPSSESVMTSMDKSGSVPNKTDLEHVKNNIHYTMANISTSSGDVYKSLLQKYYNQDLSAMTAALNKHNPSSSIDPSTTPSTTTTNDPVDNFENDFDDDDDDGDEVMDVNEDQDDSIPDRQPKPTYRPESMARNSPKGSLSALYRVHQPTSSSPRLLRRYHTSNGRSAIPVRLQTSHSHSMPHYYIPHHAYETMASHHHISLPEKSGTWLGSGLAAGILIGAIPFGIMMASMMPTLFTGAMPIVNTAAVGKRRRRRRSVEHLTLQRNLFDHQVPLDKFGVFLRRGFSEIIALLNEQHNNYMSKKSYQVATNNMNNAEPYITTSTMTTPNTVSNDVLKTVARYAVAVMDEPKCIKQMLCSLMADGRHSKTSPLQKTLYILIKWLPKDIGRTFGLDGLFTAIRKNSCFTSYKCNPIASTISTTQNNQHQHLSMLQK